MITHQNKIQIDLDVLWMIWDFSGKQQQHNCKQSGRMSVVPWCCRWGVGSPRAAVPCWCLYEWVSRSPKTSPCPAECSASAENTASHSPALCGLLNPAQHVQDHHGTHGTIQQSTVICCTNYLINFQGLSLAFTGIHKFKKYLLLYYFNLV